jgi:hypothetical protein
MDALNAIAAMPVPLIGWNAGKDMTLSDHVDLNFCENMG